MISSQFHVDTASRRRLDRTKRRSYMAAESAKSFFLFRPSRIAEFPPTLTSTTIRIFPQCTLCPLFQPADEKKREKLCLFESLLSLFFLSPSLSLSLSPSLSLFLFLSPGPQSGQRRKRCKSRPQVCSFSAASFALIRTRVG